MMISILSSFIAFFVTIPPLGLVIAYFLLRKLTKNRRKSAHQALDYTAIFFIAAVHYLIFVIWGKSFFWLIILLLIGIAMTFVIIHWKIKGEIVFKVVFKGFWRFSFLVFFILYIALTFYGLIQRVLDTI